MIMQHPSSNISCAQGLGADLSPYAINHVGLPQICAADPVVAVFVHAVTAAVTQQSQASPSTSAVSLIPASMFTTTSVAEPRHLGVAQAQTRLGVDLYGALRRQHAFIRHAVELVALAAKSACDTQEQFGGGRGNYAVAAEKAKS